MLAEAAAEMSQQNAALTLQPNGGESIQIQTQVQPDGEMLPLEANASGSELQGNPHTLQQESYHGTRTPFVETTASSERESRSILMIYLVEMGPYAVLWNYGVAGMGPLNTISGSPCSSH